MESFCPKTPNCPLFNNNLLKRTESAIAYKNNYCNDKKKYKECMRYIVSEKLGKCPDFVMPNSMLSFDEIYSRMRKEGMI